MVYKMRVLILGLCALLAACAAQPQRTKLQLGDNDSDSKPFIEEVIVESHLHVINPTAGRQARTNTQTNLKDGARVAEMKKTSK